MASGQPGDRRESRKRTVHRPKWLDAYESDDRYRLAGSEDQWPVEAITDTRLFAPPSSKGKGRRRRQYKVRWADDVDWEEDAGENWVDAKDVSEDLVAEFWQERERRGDSGDGTTSASQRQRAESRKVTGVPEQPFDHDSLSTSSAAELEWLFWSLFSHLGCGSSGKKDNGYVFKTSFTAPCSQETFTKCFCVPFAPHLLYLVEQDLPVRLLLSVEQLRWSFNYLEREKGVVCHHRDSIDSTSCSINGFVSLVWQRPSQLIYSHETCARCNAGRAARTALGDTGGLDTCSPSSSTVRLPYQLHLSFRKMYGKSLHWKI